MAKKQKILFCRLFTIFLFSLIFFISLPISKTLAVELNVDYPAKFNITGQTEMPEYLKFIFDFAMFIGFSAVFLTLVFAGVLYLLSPAIPNALAIARDRVSGAISGLLILATVYLIITTINPALSIFKTTDLKKVPPPEAQPAPAGIYFYEVTDCSMSSSSNPFLTLFPNISSLPSLEGLNKKLRSAKIVHDWQNDIHYIGILYENFKYWGKCQYIDPNLPCQKNIDPFASSISIFEYNYHPNSGGVTFYRKPFFDSSGGSYQVTGSATSEIFNRELKELKFENVPEEEQKCVYWDKKGACTKKEPQNLSAENIASIKIEGDYLVLLLYFDRDYPEPNATENGPWASCQAFGTFGDEDKEGPREIKWENIRNLNSGNLPNWVLIFPIENKKN